ncbi:hypothetical protein D3C77_607700 [compost metagenome]
MAAQQLAGRLQATDAGHLDVHQDHVGLEFAGEFQCCLAGIGFPYHLQAVDVGQHAGNARTHQIVVIDHQDPDQADTSRYGVNCIRPP